MEDSTSLGMKEILDYKIENGKQLYLVQWTPTWEASDVLMDCQPMIHRFWSKIDNATAHQLEAKEVLEAVQSHRLSEFKLTNDFKCSINNLVERKLDSPSKLLEESTKQLDNYSARRPVVESPVRKTSMSTHTFDSPYVNLVHRYECKVCGNEQKSTDTSKWKRHWLSHARQEDLPFTCFVCNKGFVTKQNMNSHMKAIHPGDVKKECF